jgi:LacI family transcriptional regulator
LFIETSREFGRELLHGIARHSRLHGPWRVYRQPAGLDSSLPDWKELRIDGAIVRDVKMVENLARSGFPVIFAQHSKERYAPFPAIMTDIATRSGFDGVEHIARYFRKEAGLSLRDYRQKYAPR